MRAYGLYSMQPTGPYTALSVLKVWEGGSRDYSIYCAMITAFERARTDGGLKGRQDATEREAGGDCGGGRKRLHGMRQDMTEKSSLTEREAG